MPTFDAEPIATNEVGKRCPNCSNVIDHMDFSCRYSEYGIATGTRDMDGDDEIDDRSCDSEDTDEYDYTCPVCNCGLDYDFFDQDDDDNEVVTGNNLESSWKAATERVERSCSTCHGVFEELKHDKSSFCIFCNGELSD